MSDETRKAQMAEAYRHSVVISNEIEARHRATLEREYMENPDRWHEYPAEKPTVAGFYLAYDPTRQIPILHFSAIEVVIWFNDEQRWGQFGTKSQSITHWMPLPDAPVVASARKAG